jgi:hypothetical protein
MPSKSRIGTFLHPQGTLLISRLFSREIRFRDIAKLVGTFMCYSKPRTPMGQQSTLLFLSGISLSGNRDLCCRDSLARKSPNPELRYARAPILRHVTSSLLSIGNRGIAISPVTIPLHNKTPNVESRPPGISCHLSL